MTQERLYVFLDGEKRIRIAQSVYCLRALEKIVKTYGGVHQDYSLIGECSIICAPMIDISEIEILQA